MLKWRSLTLALLVGVLPTSVAAQSQVEFGVSLLGGVYLPTADLFSGVINDPELGSVALEFGHSTGFGGGARFAVWPHNRVGVEAEAIYSVSDVDGMLLTQSDGGFESIDGEVSANVFMTSLNILYAFVKPPLEPLSLFVSGGIGLVSRGGDFYEPFESTTDIAGVLGLGGKYGVAPGVWLRADVRDYISSFKVSDQFDESELQNDLLINLGAELTFPRR